MYKTYQERRKYLASLAGFLVLVLLISTGSLAQSTGPADEVVVAINKSLIITSKVRFAEVSVGNPDIADVVPLSQNRLYLLGKSIGTTNIIMTDAKGRAIQVLDVQVGYDLQSLKRAIYEVVQSDEIEVRTAGNTIVLSGSVNSAGSALKIADLAESYAPDHVNNMLLVRSSQQVMLKVRFAEVARGALKEFGVNSSFTYQKGNTTIPILTGQGIDPTSMLIGGITTFGANYALEVLVDALETKGMVRTLAEPNIIAMSGETASFLAGGEFPIPVAQGSGLAGGGSNITIEFKEFGVGLSFTPTVIGSDTINLVIDSEVSSIDSSVSVSTGLINVPGLKVRRVRTTVELLDGQSFAIAGLIQDDFESTINAIPGLGSIPILGALFRSNKFKRRETELVLIITVRLVRPTTMDRLASPTESFRPPLESDFFLRGRTERLSQVDGAAGFDGEHGYSMP